MKKPLHIFLAGFFSGVLVVAVSFGMFFHRVIPELDGEVARMNTDFSMESLAEACHTHFRLVGAWPSTLAELRTERGTPFLETHPQYNTDGWDHAFSYTPYDATAGFCILASYGADGIPGGIGPATDIELRLTDYGTAKPWPIQ